MRYRRCKPAPTPKRYPQTCVAVRSLPGLHQFPGVPVAERQGQQQVQEFVDPAVVDIRPQAFEVVPVVDIPCVDIQNEDSAGL